MASLMKNQYKLMANPNSHSRITCAAYGCDMRSGTNAFSEIKMFHFPKNPFRRRRWELATRRANWSANSKSRLCCKHFITGKPSKDPKHPDYVPSVFVFNENQSLKKSFSKMKKKLNCSEAKKTSFFETSGQTETSENLTDLDSSSNGELMMQHGVASSCGKGFCATCFSPASVSAAFKVSLAPLNKTLEHLKYKLKDMEEEREQLRIELATCREEIHHLQEAHKRCDTKSRPARKRQKMNNMVSSPPPSSEDVIEILESMYTEEPADVDDPDSIDSQYLEEISHHSPYKPSNSKRQKKPDNDVIGIIEQCSSPKRNIIRDTNLSADGTNEMPISGKTYDSGSPITIVYLKR